MKLRITNYELQATMAMLILSFILSGCVVRSYPLTRERVDQDLSTGNRGYLQGRAPASEGQERETTRTTRVVEIELHSPIKFERMHKAKTEENVSEGNKGYITQSVSPEIAEPPQANMEKYTVQKGDTLQKVSNKFYGTTKKWKKIFEANKENVKGFNKIYPGQVIDVPVEGMKETKGNLK